MTGKLVDKLGGLAYHYTEGGGCCFYVARHQVDMSKEQMQKSASDFMLALLEKVFQRGVDHGRSELKKELRDLLGAKSA